jgi:outer membrane biosynthesis protein TonB
MNRILALLLGVLFVSNLQAGIFGKRLFKRNQEPKVERIETPKESPKQEVLPKEQPKAEPKKEPSEKVEPKKAVEKSSAPKRKVAAPSLRD